MKYLPKRDLPKAVRELRTVSPSKIAEWIRQHRTREVKGKRVQWEITSKAITMYFKRHADLYEQLRDEVQTEELSRHAITEDFFQNGTFRQIPCIQNMIIEMRGRGAKEESINSNLSMVKRICMGQLPQRVEQLRAREDPIIIEGWGLKHPRVLTLESMLKFNSEMIKHKVGNRDWRLAMRCFLISRGLKGWEKLSGAYKGAGKYAHLYAPPEQMRDIFTWLKRMNKEVHDACYFAFKTGCRIGATLSAHAKYVDVEAKTIWVFEKASKHGDKRKLKKKISSDLWELLEPRVAKGGQLFNITEKEVNGLLRACYEEVLPKLVEDIPMPFHFFRHQFAQHGLRHTGWNTSLIARLGGWTVGVLERYYGKMDEQTAFSHAEQFLPNL